MRYHSFSICLALFLFTIFCAGCATVKVTESSVRRAPQWVFGAEHNFLIVSAEAEDIETAKNKALNEVKKQMVNAISENIRTTSHTTTEELGVDDAYATVELYREELATESGNVPFLSQVTLANVTDYYWEKRYDKKTKAEWYVYHLKYPFSRLNQDELIAKFEAQEAAINRQLKELEQVDFSTFSSVEQMVAQGTALRTFQSTLMENDGRRKACDRILRGYKSNVEQLTIQAVSVDREKTLYEVYLGEKKMACNIRPYLRSKCLEQMNWQVKDGVNVVTYDYSECFEDEQNYIDITITVMGKKINHRYFIL